MKRKILVISMSLVLMTSFAGCGEQKEHIVTDSLAEQSIMPTDETVSDMKSTEERVSIVEYAEMSVAEEAMIEEAMIEEAVIEEAVIEEAVAETFTMEVIPESQAETEVVAKIDREATTELNIEGNIPVTEEVPQDTSTSDSMPIPATFTCTGDNGHAFEKTYWPSEPTCQGAAHYYLVCVHCGADGGEGTDPALEHTLVEMELRHGNCKLETLISYDCSSCGSHIRDESHTEPDNHEWATKQSEGEWDEETQSVIYPNITYCVNCGIYQ